MSVTLPNIVPPDLPAFILAGGKSSRMGTDKGLMLFEGEPMIVRIIRQLQKVMQRVIIVSNNPVYKSLGIEVFEDIIRNAGPVGGIYTAMHHYHFGKFFVVSCDMPFITPEAISFIIRKGGDGDSRIVLPLYQKNVQPLFGLYPGDCLEEWKQLMERGHTKLREIITHFDVKKVPVDNGALFNDRLFTNINDKNDLENALKRRNHDD